MFSVFTKQAGSWATVALLLILTGCTSTPERQPLPPEYTLKASIPGIPDARFWGDEWPTFAAERFETFTVADFHREFDGVYEKPHNYLAISGGGANGAFGAGLLVGWSATGERPEFSMVTGVSTGALTAPFAFLGSDYDDEMKEVYTNTTTHDIATKRNVLDAAFGDSVTDTAPLQKLIAKYIDAEMIDAIAREHKRGRRLFIGTVNLDAARSVIWNIGAIAASDYPQKAGLIRELLRASAAIPVAFPPVFISVEAEGKQYDEMHVDGGTGSQVFVYPAAADWRFVTEKLKVQGKPQVYVIRNSFLDPDYQGMKRNVLPIASRTIDSLIRTQGVGDLYQIYALCRRDGNDFNLAYIPSDFTEEPTEGFDPVYMKKLLDRGYQMALDGYPWETAPPGFILSP
ncbi:MAG: patatin-like phospholipase family protein [Gammaproteobacteria bacterium]|nr:patatin-like phospholipase family protein [Gammaproteobacteria bacterium]